ncbi:MAG: OmpA family protein [Chitinophagales bacterium]
MDKKGNVVKKEGEFKLEGGYYVDENNEVIKRKIDKTKEKINATVDKTKKAVGNAADKTADGVKSTFKDLFNAKAVGTTYALSEIVFDKKSHRITTMSKEEIEGLAAALKEYPNARIQVQVHTADGKNRSESKQISKLRAEVVKSMVVALGVDEKQISAKGMGLTVEDAKKAVDNKVEVVVEKEG